MGSEGRRCAIILGELPARAKLPKWLESSSVTAADWRLEPGHEGSVRPGEGKAAVGSF